MKTMVTNIQRFSLHDGPGIRTTVFLKGCSLHCPWCANPENISFKKESYYDNDNNSNGIYGYEITNEELYDEIIKDKDYYNNDGGVTLSGGEPLMQYNNIKPLLSRLHNENISVFIETSLFVPTDILIDAIDNIDGFIVDCKIIDKKKCNDILGGNISLYLNNLKELFDRVDSNKIMIRIPLIRNFTDDKENVNNILNLLKTYRPYKIEIFSGHSMAEKKYISLGKTILSDVKVNDEYLNEIKKKFIDNNLNVEIIKI